LYDLKQLRFPALIHFRREMRELHSAEIIQIPDDVEVTVKGRVVTVTGPRGTLTRDLRHRFYDMSVIKRNNGSRIFKCEVWFGKGRDVACIKTFCTHVSNMIIGVTKGYRYRMRFAYAHFPINVSVSDDGKNVEVRNFLGEKLVRRITVREGVTAARTDPAKQKDELTLEGNDLELVSRSAADVHQSCLVKKKDIRKFLDGIYVSQKETVIQDD
jgi:large subunit ribosomal protein L9e